MTRYANKKTAKQPVPPTLIAYHVTDAKKEGEKGFWTKIGAAWDHKDGGGLTLQLDLVPVNGGRIILRAPRAEEATEATVEGEGA